MKKSILMCIIMMLTLCLPSMAQEVVKNSNTTTVVRKGNVFKSNKVNNKQSKETKTNFEYENSKGESFPIYLSSTGKAFIKVVSKKTGKEYRRYLPEVGKQINPKAYVDKKA